MEKILLERRLNQFLGASVYGTGISVLGYQPFSNGCYHITLWITFFFIPILPLTSRLVRPFKVRDKFANILLRSDKFGFEIVGQVPLRIINILRTYLQGWSLAFLALTPSIICVRQGQIHWPNGGSPGWFVFLTVASVIWPILILGILNQRKMRIHEGLLQK